MFKPSLTEDERRQIADLQTRLAEALREKPVEDSPELAPLITKRAELTAEIGGIERGAGITNLEDAAHLLANRRTQLGIVERQISELNLAREKAESVVRKERAEAIAAVSHDARMFLAEVADDFQKQHREALERAVGQYATSGSAQVRNVIALLPWFLQYLRRIRAFREGSADAPQLLEYLADAAEAKDFLMHPTS